MIVLYKQAVWHYYEVIFIQRVPNHYVCDHQIVTLNL